MTIEDLLQPIDAAAPSGVPLLHEPEFDAIEAARREDDPRLPRGVWTAELKRADWSEVARLCREVLGTRSKDLQVAAWLGEAWIALEGTSGGTRATELVTALCERFWDSLHPLPRDGDIEFRTAPLAWLDEHWSTALLVRVPLLREGGAGTADVSLAQWREALAQENAERKDKKAAPSAAGMVTRAQVLVQVRGTALAEMRTGLARLDDWLARLDRLQAVLRERLAQEAPLLHRLRAVVGEARGVVAGWMGERPDYAQEKTAVDTAAADAAEGTAAAPVPPGETAPDAAVPVAPVASSAPPPPGAIASRADAYARLRTIADYLTQLEPHSPVPLLLRRAVDWGGMPFEKLIGELSHNNNEMQKVLLREPLG